MEQKTDVTEKWLRTGLLRDVLPRDRHRIAARLEAALGQRIRSQDLRSLDRELQALEREGAFHRSMNSRPIVQ